jgi:hypothetical protein
MTYNGTSLRERAWVVLVIVSRIQVLTEDRKRTTIDPLSGLRLHLLPQCHKH